MSSNKSLKDCNIKDIELAIAKAISEVTGLDTTASLNDLKVTKNEMPDIDGKDNYELQVSLKVAKSYDSPW